jgi:hypothetical protein
LSVVNTIDDLKCDTLACGRIKSLAFFTQSVHGEWKNRSLYIHLLQFSRYLQLS